MAIDVDPDWWKSLFDEIYLLTDARSVCDDKTTELEVDLLKDLLPLGAGDRILDLCGGHGRHSLELGRRGHRSCTVLDYSACLIAKGRQAAAAENLPVKFLQGDASATGLDDGTFDHVLILGNSLGYQDAEEGDRLIAAEARRLLRGDGWLLVDAVDGDVLRERFTANAWHEIGDDIIVCREREIDGERVRAREIVVSRREGLLRENRYAVRAYRPGDLSALFEAAGFEDISLRGGPGSAEGEDRGFMNHRLFLTARKRGA